MRQKGITRDVDKLGRIVIPKSFRKTLNIDIKDKLEIYTEGDTIIMKKYAPFCIFCGSEENIKDFGGKKICAECIEKIKQM